jgi:hypothetical protein
MKYPKLNEIPTSRDLLDKFKGYNHNLRIGEGQFYDMKNLTGDDYPILSPRKKRGIYLTPNKPNGMCSNTNFCYVDGRDFYIGDQSYDLKLTDSTKDLISIGTNVVVMPDQKYINTVLPSARGTLRNGTDEIPDKDVTTGKTRLAIELTNPVFENVVAVIRKGQIEPKADDYRGKYLIKITDSGATLYQSQKEHYENPYGSGYAWVWEPHYSNDGSYSIKITLIEGDTEHWNTTLSSIWSATNNGEKLIYVKGITTELNDYVFKVAIDVNKGELVLQDSSFYHTDFNVNRDKYLPGLLFGRTKNIHLPYYLDNATLSVIAPFDISTDIPSMDYIIESSNRLWGCRYGSNNKGDFVNEIYASELGKFKNWEPLEDATVATSPYIVPVGTSGKFTGAINYGGKPIFFKEDCMHRVFGDFPANYQVKTIMCKGVQEGCSKSLAIVNDVLYYKSRSGICAFDGSLPVEISAEFGDKQYKNAVAGAIGNKYYVSMQDEEGEWSLFVYDTVKRMWHKEDDTQVTQFCNHKGELYYIDYADNNIHTVKGTGVIETKPIPWSAETGILGASTPDDKYVTKIDIRMSVAKGSKMSLHIEYDSMGEWERLMEIEGLTLNTFTIPVRPRRCDHFRLKFEGEGDAKIFSISKTLEETE